jgi:hypothetical protein
MTNATTNDADVSWRGRAQPGLPPLRVRARRALGRRALGRRVRARRALGRRALGRRVRARRALGRRALGRRALGRRALVAAALAGMVCAGAACTSSHAASTPKPTALVIPPPFEVRQQVGFGSVTIRVDSFRRTGDNVTVNANVTNDTATPIPVSSEPSFMIFYGTGLHAAARVTGLDDPIAPNASATVTLDFVVPAAYKYPLVWFTSKASGVGPDTIVLRGAHT